MKAYSKVEIITICPTCGTILNLFDQIDTKYFTLSGAVEIDCFCCICGDVFIVDEIEFLNSKKVEVKKTSKEEILNYKNN